MKYVPPKFKQSVFHCPRPECGAYAKQTWRSAHWQQNWSAIRGLMLSMCDHCENFSIWLDGNLLFPATRTAPLPHPAMPVGIKTDYEEARAVYQDSARSSAALLRLAIQKLCMELGQPGKNLNADIGELVGQGLPVLVQRSLDIVRVVGNNQVHPGMLDVRDNPDIALMLFELVNIIVEDRIARPKQVDELYNKLPEGARKQIEERDKPQP